MLTTKARPSIITTMFVRQKKLPNRTLVQIVKSIRDGDKIRQKMVRHVGTARSDAQLEQLLLLGQIMVEELRSSESAQQFIFSPKQYAELALQNRHSRKRPVAADVRLQDCREESRINVGFREAMGEMYRLMGWQRLLGARRMSANRIIEELVIARIAQPLSKRATVRELHRFGDVRLNLEQVYNTMDYITDKVIENIRARSCEVTEKLFPEPITMIFYDTTTLYFESERDDALKDKGYSKDGKANRVQVVFALLITAQGLPLGYELFPGSMFEGHTLIDAVRQMQRRFPQSEFTLVADAAMISKENQALLKHNNIAYILGARLKSQPNSFKKKILRDDDFLVWSDNNACHDWGSCDQNPPTRYKSVRKGEDRYVVTFSPKRAAKDARLRAKGVEKLKKKLSKSKQVKSISNRGYARFLDIPNGQVKINEDKIEAAARWDGLGGIVAWGHDATDARQLVMQYRRLWQIEACFRTNKHDLKIRPIFHWAPKRIKAHIAICYMAFCCLQHLRHRLRIKGHDMSADVIRRELNSLQISILVERHSSKKYALPSKAKRDARRIYRSLGLEWNEVPFTMDSKPQRKTRTKTR